MEEKGVVWRRRVRDRGEGCGMEKKGEGERRRVWYGEKRREREKESVG